MLNQVAHILRILQPYALAISFTVIYIAEHIIPQKRELIDHHHDVINILIGLGNLLVAAIGGFYLQIWLSNTVGNHFGLLYVVKIPSWLQLISGFILVDLVMYWWHRANHEYRFFWRFHRFHHLDEKLNSTSALRFHFIEILLSYVVRFSLFPLLGLSVAAVLLHGLTLFPIIVFHHSNVRIGSKWDLRLRCLFVTPLMHRIHHSRIRRETDSNYGSIFPYWDAIFGSYIHQPDKEIEFGIEDV